MHAVHVEGGLLREDRDTARALHGIGVQMRVAMVHAARAANSPRLRKQRLRKRRLTGIDMGDEPYHRLLHALHAYPLLPRIFQSKYGTCAARALISPRRARRKGAPARADAPLLQLCPAAYREQRAQERLIAARSSRSVLRYLQLTASRRWSGRRPRSSGPREPSRRYGDAWPSPLPC